jgi:hypothetical protein
VTPPKSRKTALVGRLIGYARVSTDEQGTDPQLDELVPRHSDLDSLTVSG